MIGSWQMWHNASYLLMIGDTIHIYQLMIIATSINWSLHVLYDLLFKFLALFYVHETTYSHPAVLCFSKAVFGRVHVVILKIATGTQGWTRSSNLLQAHSPQPNTAVNNVMFSHRHAFTSSSFSEGKTPCQEDRTKYTLHLRHIICCQGPQVDRCACTI